MRYGIFSDVHANLEALETVLKVYKKEDIDVYLCVGDLVGYAANPRECIELVREICDFVVAGNHDWATAERFPIDYFNDDAKKALIWTKSVLQDSDRNYLAGLSLVHKNDDLTLVHGTLAQPELFDYMTDTDKAEKTFELLENNICFVGHLHISGVFIRDKNKNIYYEELKHLKLNPSYSYIINVGSIGQPRDGDPSSCYCIFDTEKKEVWIKKISYDIKSTYNKIIKAGLPPFLGYRLFLGR